MNKQILSLFILTLVLAGAGFAQASDSIGVYLDNGLHGAIEPAGSVIDLHVVVKDMSATELSGFEMKLVTEGPLAVLGSSIAYPIQAINIASRPNEFIVGYSGPVPALGGVVEVMTFSALVTGIDAPGLIFIKPVYFSSVEDVPSYLVNTDSGELVELRQSTGGPDDAVFLVNDLPVSTKSATFDELKSLYR